MSFRLEMLQVARVAPKVLGEATELVEAFLRSQQHPEGGFVDREGKPDLYYTVFGMEGLAALQATLDWDAVAVWLRGFGDGDGLDFIHLCCLARCWSSVGRAGLDPAMTEALLRRIEAFRSADGGYHQAPGRDNGSAYGMLLGWSAYQDLGEAAPGPEALAESLEALRTGDGGWSNERGQPFGLIPAAAAAVALRRHLGLDPDAATADWILKQALPDGGFRAVPGIPVPDLLSTAVALHALDAMQADWSRWREPCLNFVDSLWNAEGGFHGNWTDDELDCEYTYYGLLSLGHLGI